MKRKKLKSELRFAGYHNNIDELVRLYTENRISLKFAKKHFQRGKDKRVIGMKCNCQECIKLEDADYDFRLKHPHARFTPEYLKRIDDFFAKKNSEKEV